MSIHLICFNSPAPGIEKDQRLRAELVAEALRFSGRAAVRVFGGSMWPWLRSGDTLLVRREEPARVRIGEIVLFVRDGRLFAHRVIRRTIRESRLVLVTKGDTLPRADAPLDENEFLGRVVAVRRGTQEIDLAAHSQRAIGRAAAFLTYSSLWWYPLALAVKRVLPARTSVVPR